MKVTRILIPAAVFILLAGCEDKLDINTDAVRIPEIPVLRLDRDLFSLKEGEVRSRTPELKQKYGAWYEHYIMSFLDRRGTNDSIYPASVVAYTGDNDVKRAFRQAEKIYDDRKMNEIGGEVNQMAKRFHFHFPSKAVPAKLVACMSGWNYSFAYMDSALIVGLDMYLGDTSSFYKMLAYPQYQVRKMNSDHLLPDIARGWLLTEFDDSAAVNTLIHHTIFYGKLFYAVEALLPKLHDSLIIGYTGKQIAYCNKFEKNLWGYMASQNRLYENNLNTVRELTTDGPFTGAISKECPPRIAMWVGWQIIRSYMDKNKDVTLEELMRDRDAQGILARSKYRP